MSQVFYRGVSQIDNSTLILGLITGLDRPTSNRKTGDMLQTWILLADTSPVDAVKTGADSAICGTCPHRPANNNTCYVVTHQAPRQIWSSKQTELDFKNPRLFYTPLRIGAYGDPTAIPYATWEKLVKFSPGHTGYTHNWEHCDPDFRKILMASVDSVSEHEKATSMGWRTYRVKTDAAPILNGETYCPSYKGITCSQCQLCKGSESNGKHITINVHGTQHKVRTFNERQSANL